MLETYEFKEEAQPKQKNPARVWNILTIVVLTLTICIGTWFAMIFINPQSPFNPFPPPVVAPLLDFPTPTHTPRFQLPPTWTPTPTLEPIASPTLFPTSTPVPSPTPFSLVSPSPDVAATLSATTPEGPTPTVAGMPFVIKGGAATYLENIAHPDKGCSWMGVAGRVFDLKGSTVQGQQIMLGGYLTGSTMPTTNMLTLTGLAQEYGPGYYELPLADLPIASEKKLWIQLLDQAGIPMSEKYYFNTYDDCLKNMILIDFQQVK